MEIDLRQQERRATRKAGSGPTAISASPWAARLPVLPITVGAAQAVAHRGWVTARDAALAALRSGPCVVAVAGAPGTGKTLLLEELGRVLTKGGFTTVLHPRGDFGEHEAAGARAAPLRVVLIDEADRLDQAALARLAADNQCGLVLTRRRSPADFGTDPLCRAAAGSRPVTFVRLASLFPGETGPFVSERLARAGLPAAAIGEAGIAEIERFSGRIPRLVNMLASAALFLAASNDAAQVDAEHVAEAAALRGLTVPAKPEEPLPAAVTPQPEDEGQEEDHEEEGGADLAPIPMAVPAAIPPKLPEPARPAPVIVPPVAEAAPMPAAAKSTVRKLLPVDRPLVLRRAAILALCIIGSGAAAVGWFASRETAPAAVRHSGQSARAATALVRPAGTSTAAAANVTPATPQAAAAATPTRPAATQHAAVAAPPGRVPPAPSGVAPRSAAAPPSPPAETPATPPGAMASSSGQPGPATSASSPPAEATEAAQIFAQAGATPGQDVAPAAVLGTPTNAPRDPSGAAAKPTATVAPVTAAAKPSPVESKPAAAPAPAGPAPAPQILASPGVKPPTAAAGAVAPSPPQPDRLALFVPPLPPPTAPPPSVANATPSRSEVARNLPRTPAPPRASAEPPGGWGPLSLSNLEHSDVPPQPAPTHHSGPAPRVLGTLRTHSSSPAPPDLGSPPEPQRYVGVYVTQPDGRRTFIAAP